MSDADAFDRIEMAQEIKTLRSRLAAAESRAERLAEAMREEAAWLKDMAERTQHFVLPSSCGERAERVRAVLAEVGE